MLFSRTFRYFHCVYVKRITVCNCLCSFSSSSHFSANCVRDFGIVNCYFLFWKYLKMADRGGKFGFFQGIHVRNVIRIDISICMNTITTKFGKQVHLGELTQMRLIKQVLMTLSCEDHVTNVVLVHFISTSTVPMFTKHGWMVANFEGLLPIMLLYLLITWSCEITWHIKTIIFSLPYCQKLTGLWLTLRGSFP